VIEDYLYRMKYRPQGQPTRGKTRRNRLRRVDNFLLLYDGALIRQRSGAFCVDLGYGAEPFTTLESADRLRRANPTLPVLGVEIDPERVARAIPYEDELTQFRLGGFNIPLVAGETVRLIRAFNVLRQYDESEVSGAWITMGRALQPGGLLIEGTSDPYGRIWTANLLRRVENNLNYEGLLFSTNFHGGFEPAGFQPILPKNCIHRMVPGEKINDFMEAWKLAFREVLPYKHLGLRQQFALSARILTQRGYSIDQRSRLLRRGYLLWKASPGERVFLL
jgi:hypothetical protein